MTALRPILKYQLPVKLDPEQGEIGEFAVVPIGDLRVDPTFQRSISAASARNVVRIGTSFDWRRFSPVIGVRLADGKIGVIDGQHRCTAAHSRGIAQVPVYLLDCSMTEAASAFAAINGNVTPISKQDIYRAKLAAGDKEALALQSVLDVAGVTIVSIRSGFAKGQTRSIGVLHRAYRVHGADILILTLQCLTETGDGNAGLIYGVAINGIADAIKTKTEWLAKPSALLDCFDQIDLRAMLQSVEAELVRQRQACMWVMYRHTKLSLPSIGRLLGGRNHTTVHHGVRKVEAERQLFAGYVARIFSELV